MAVMVPMVFLINGLTKHNWHRLLFRLAVAVGMTPRDAAHDRDGVSFQGGHRHGEEEGHRQRLNSIQNLGAMDVLCTDKTGT